MAGVGGNRIHEAWASRQDDVGSPSIGNEPLNACFEEQKRPEAPGAAATFPNQPPSSLKPKPSYCTTEGIFSPDWPCQGAVVSAGVWYQSGECSGIIALAEFDPGPHHQYPFANVFLLSYVFCKDLYSSIVYIGHFMILISTPLSSTKNTAR